MEQSRKKTYYEMLNISEDATEGEIREAYELLKETYGGGSAASYSMIRSEDAARTLEQIGAAYEVLGDRAKRRLYDAQLREGDLAPSVGTAAGQEPEGRSDAGAAAAESEKGVRPVDSRLVMIVAPQSLVAEQFRVLGSRIDLLAKERKLKVIAVTSAIKGEGKTITAANLALALAVDFRKRVLLIEGDLQQPVLHSFLGSPFKFGLADVLLGRVDMESAVVTFMVDSLSLLPGGDPRLNSAQVLGSGRFPEMIRAASSQYDYVVIDEPPVLQLADMTLFGEVVDGILVVVRLGRSTKSLIRKAIASLPSDKIIGAVANDVGMPVVKL